MIKRFNIEDDLARYLRERAQRNRRSMTAEMNAILSDLREADGAPVENELGEEFIQIEPATKGPLPTVSGYRGVYPYGKRWIARRMHQGKLVKIGVFDDQQEAAQAYDDWLRANVQQEDPGVVLNFPREGEEKIPTDELSYEEWEALTAPPNETLPGLPDDAPNPDVDPPNPDYVPPTPPEPVVYERIPMPEDNRPPRCQIPGLERSTDLPGPKLVK